MENEIDATKKKLKRKRRITRKKTVVDSAARNAAKLTDGCNPEFVKGAEFEGIFETGLYKNIKDRMKRKR